MNNYRNLCFDYGGTLDTGGIHWADFLWQVYQQHLVPVTHEAFYDAYVHTERYLGQHDVIHPENTFREVLDIKVRMQLEELLPGKGRCPQGGGVSNYPSLIVDSCYSHVLSTMETVRPILQQLSSHHTLILVSNFYGNLSTVLREFQLDGYFHDVIESAAVGIRKPDAAIYELALSRNHLRPDETLVIGDSLKNDILPAHSLGIPTVWLAPHADNIPEEATYHITTINQLLDITNNC